ncbi:MAG TPA: RNA 2',3'-cyclic phosphodiesterase [Desulfobulbus sp.]|nr:RNA 2',3'-cyclic phosphodiesterase [Desulfobulbus sp.]
MRLFVAIDLPEKIKEQVAGLCCGLPGARWVNPEQLHLTLRFIGEVDGGMFRDIRETLDEVRSDPFTLQLDGVGFFPPRGKPRVAWVGLRQSVELSQLRNRIESRLAALGLEPETRKFSPHITLARLKNTPASKVGRFLETHNLFLSPPFTIKEFFLYSSRLGRNGAIHRIEAGYPLR